ncbi:MAG: SPASM domain-containing protein [Patescibacteria group bacterium]|nr:SPASM domain-containing protein [Patescibacteria group bacterium]
MSKLDYFSNQESKTKRLLRKFFSLPRTEIINRSLNVIRKKIGQGILPWPQNIHLEVTNNCNLACPMCINRVQTRKKGFMSLALYQKILKQVVANPYLEKLALMGLGEPLLHPRFVKMSRLAKKMGVKHVYTSTNATLLNKKLTQKLLIKPSLDLLIISLDGFKKNTYEQIRCGATYQKVLNNIFYFINQREKMKLKKPRLVIQFLLMKKNFKEKKDFIKFWRNRLDRQDTIYIRDVDTFGGQVPDLRLKLQKINKKRKPCVQLFRDFLVSWDGKVTVCCKDLHYTMMVGDLNKQTIQEIWMSKKWQQIRKKHFKKLWRQISLCANCNEWMQ